MSDFEKLNIVLAARDREFARAMDRNTRRIERFTKGSNKRLSGTTRALGALTRGAIALLPAITAAFSFTVVRNAANFAKEIQNASNVAGVGAAEFQRLAAAALTVGVSQEKLADVYKDINERVGEFIETGAGPMKDFFEFIAPAVGVTADQFARLSGPEALQLYVDSLERAGVSQQEMTFYLEAMASDTSALIPLLRDGGAEMARLGREAQDAGRILSDDTVEGLGELKDELDAVQDELRNQFMTAVADSSDEILILADFVRDYGVPALEGLISVASGAAQAFDAAATAISEFIRLGNVAAGMPNPNDAPEGANYSSDDFGPGGADPDGRAPSSGQTGFVDADGNWVEYGVGDPGAQTPVPGITGPVPPPVRVRAPGSRGTKGKKSGGSGKSRLDEQIRKNIDAMVDFEAMLARLDTTTQGARDVANDYTDTLARLQLLYDSGEISLKEYEHAVDLVEDEFRDVIRAAEDMETATEDMFASIVTGAKSGKEAIGDLLASFAQMAAKSAFSGMFGGMFDDVSWIFGGGAKSFDGGGYTGDGPRSGGLDGKGGYMAMLHPRESVVDHTRGQSAGSAGGGGGVGSIQVVVSGARGNSEVSEMVRQGVRQGLQEYDRAVLPRRVGQISNDPRKVS